MVRTLIVGSDCSIIEHLRSQIAWDSMGFTWVGIAHNAITGAALFEKEAPDVVITTLEMPETSGIALAQKIRSIDREVRLVFITDCADFEETRAALDLDASGYILTRELGSDETRQKFLRIKQEVEENACQCRQITQLSLISFFHEKRKGINTVPKRLKAMSGKKLGFMMLIQNHPFPSLRAALGLQLVEPVTCGDIQSALKGIEGLYVVRDRDYHYLLLCDMDSLIKGKRFADACQEILAALSDALQITFSMIVLGEYVTLEDCRALHKRANAVANKHYFYACGSVLYLSTLTQQENTFTPGESGQLFPTLQDDADKICEYIDQIYMALADRMDDRGLVEFIFLLSRDLVKKYRVNQGFSLIDIEHMAIPRQDIQRWMTAEGAISYIKEKYNLFGSVPSKHYSHVVMAAIHYIQQCFHVHTLNADLIAKHLHISEARLRGVFKTETGFSVYSYITNYRIERAKELLLFSNERMDEIANAVGYINGKYLSRVFKKEVGQSPLAFRNRMLQSGEVPIG